MKKKIFGIILIILILFNFTIVYADDITDEEEELSDIELQEVSANVMDEPQINSRAGIVYDRDTGMVLYEKNINSKRAMASTTKIMTAIVVLENANLNDTVTISKKAGGTGGSRLGLKAGDKITVSDLLYGLMLKSGNDSAVALAEHIGGSVEGFAKKMNDKAKELKLSNTNFVTPHGLDDKNHYTTVFSLARLTDYALGNKRFAEIVQTKNYTVNINGQPKSIANTNELLGVLNGVYGVKTGFTNNAGRCLVTAVKRGDINVIVIVLGADTKKFRTMDSVKLIEYTYKNFCKINIKEKIDEEFNSWKLENLNKFKINKGINNNVELEFENIKNNYITVKNNKINSVKIIVNCVLNYEAPLKKNEIIGTIKIYVENKIVNIINIRNKNEIKRKNEFDYFKQFLSEMILFNEKANLSY